MIIYEVTAVLEPHLALASGCFHSAEFASAAPGRYRMRYEASTDEDLERYLATHAARLREDATSRFPEGVILSREVWTAIQRWDGGPWA